MNAPRLEFHPEARLDLFDALEWYAERSPDAAASFFSELDAAIERVLDAPLRWREAQPDVHIHRLHIYPHSLIYRVAKGEVTIIAVALGSRRPGYWRDRLGN